MKSEELLSILSDVETCYIEEASEGNEASPKVPVRGQVKETETRSRRKVSVYKMIRVGAAAAAVLICGALFVNEGKTIVKINSMKEEVSSTETAIEEYKAEAEGLGREFAKEMTVDNSFKAPEAPAAASDGATAEGKPASPEPTQETGFTMLGSVYPQTVEYPDSEPGEAADAKDFDWNKFFDEYNEKLEEWLEADSERKKLAQTVGIPADFTRSTMKQFLQSEKDENTLYSPLNVYMALGLLAETTDGNSRKQVLDLMGVSSIEELREDMPVLIGANYRDDGRNSSIPAASIWLDDELSYNNEAIRALSEYYFASSFVGDLQSSEVDGLFRDWLNEQTKGLLKDQVSELEITDETRAILAETLYYKASFVEKFFDGATKEDVFRSKTGDEKADFMARTDMMEYYKGKTFTAACLELTDGDKMWLILPDEKLGTDGLLKEDELYDFLENGSRSCSDARVMVKMPKFDVCGMTDLVEGLQSLGVTDVFTDGADFSPLTPESLCVDSVSHAVRVKTDEEGVEAAAFTVMMVKATGAMPQGDPLAFICDRPFMFVIETSEGIPLFTGTVNHVK